MRGLYALGASAVGVRIRPRRRRNTQTTTGRPLARWELDPAPTDHSLRLQGPIVECRGQGVRALGVWRPTSPAADDMEDRER
jgi:hypothetical protein